VVLGGTGNQGRAVAQSLAASDKFTVVCVVRNPESKSAKSLSTLGGHVTLIKGDFDDGKSFEQAFKGADVVFACTPMAPDKEVGYGKMAADAALAANVKLFIWSSIPSAMRLSGGKYDKVAHFDEKEEVNKYLKTIPVNSIVLNLTVFSENDINFGLIQKAGDGYIRLTAGYDVDRNNAYSCISKDLGPAVAVLIDHYINHPIPDRPVRVVSYYNSLNEQAEIMSRILGAKVTNQVTPPFGNVELVQMVEFLNEFGLYDDDEFPDPILAKLGWKPTSYETWAKEELAPWVKSST